jgi:hypothetical protein
MSGRVPAYSDAGQRRMDKAEAMNPVVKIIKAFTSFWLWTG